MWNGVALLTLPYLFGGRSHDADRAGRFARRAPADEQGTGRATMATPDELALVAQVREGSEADARAAFDAVYARTYAALVRFGVRLIGDGEAAHDAVQDVFVALWLSRTVWHAPGGIDAYLYAAVRNRLLKRLRHDSVVGRADPARAPVPAAPPLPDAAAEATELDGALAAVLAELPERRRTAFLLRAVDGLGYEAIGEVLGISGPAAYKQVAAATQVLRARLARFAG